ncbi:MAG: bifunctional homocysteine S-methyltransferase/methylenetetrahydrofolate reductase [Planctomycetaceae bacterium]|nr:bifunctional homocysteine S-methyltransferase/methylenetetrahydrofolate reductase [Planctomycetaceae bacterium]
MKQDNKSDDKNNAQKSFFDAIRQGILVFDGPMGTELYRHHIFTNRCYDELNLSAPELVKRVHMDYCKAGADVLTTNTYGANRLALEKYGLADKIQEINRRGVAIAREAAKESGETLSIAGSVGPIVSSLHAQTELLEIIAEQVGLLHESGVDLIIFETQPSRESLERCVLAMQRFPETPYLLSCAIVHDCESVSGETITRLFAPFETGKSRLAAVGINCGLGPDGILEAVEQAVQVTTLPLVVQPNAGTPKEFEGRTIYYCSPEYIATYAMRYVDLGAAAVGGCCGTTPDHIREIAGMIKPLSRARASHTNVLQSLKADVEEKPESNFADRSRFAWKLANKQWVTTVELVPPRGYDLLATVDKAKTLHRHGVDAINLPDGPRASSRISSLVVAEVLQNQARIETILHFCCRDRNLIGMQADLLGCAAAGIRNLLFVTGDPPKLGLYPNATGVFDTDSIGMCSVQRRLNRSVDLGGQSIEPGTDAVIGVGLDPTSLDRQREKDRFWRKIEAGAEFAITQPVFDPDFLLSFLDEIGNCPIPILAGIWPLASYRNAQFLQNEVPGVVIPDAMMQRMKDVSAKTLNDQLAVGIEIARECVERVRDTVAGIQISAPFGRIETALAVMER